MKEVLEGKFENVAGRGFARPFYVNMILIAKVTGRFGPMSKEFDFVCGVGLHSGFLRSSLMKTELDASKRHFPVFSRKRATPLF